VDRDGDDRYEIERSGLGSGSWLGLGVLLELAGSDTFQVGSGAIGVGESMGTGLFLELAGNDVYRFGSRSMGVGIAEGAGWFVDAGGEDHYEGTPAMGGGPYADVLGVVFDGTDADWRVPTEAVGLAIDLEQDAISHLPGMVPKGPDAKGRALEGDGRGLGGVLFLMRRVSQGGANPTGGEQ
jgi:hypothetical protein